MKLIDAVLVRLKVVMAEKNATLSSIHRNGGIAKSALSQLLSGKQQKVSLDLLYEILSTIEVPLKYFFDDPIFDEVTG